MNVADTSTNRANFGQRLPTIPALIGSVNTSALYKGESQGKKFPSDWKERKCSLFSGLILAGQVLPRLSELAR
jgi:hypothetical protein